VATPAKHSTHTLRIRSRTELLSEIREFVSKAARGFGFNDTDVGKIELAIDEACTNVIKHAYGYNPDGIIEIAVTGRSDEGQSPRFIVEIIDSGIPFDSSKYSTPDMKEYFRKLRHGGLGIVLMKKLMDEVEYLHSPGSRNTIRLVKYLPS
jgi:serine/threonine-protein kinase RsbW